MKVPILFRFVILSLLVILVPVRIYMGSEFNYNYGYRYLSASITMIKDTLVLNNVKPSISNADYRFF